MISSVPYKKGDFWYFTRTEEGKQYPVYYRSKAKDGKDAEVLLDQNAMAEGYKYFAVGEFDVSDDGNILAFATDTTGYRQYTLQFKDLRTWKNLPGKNRARDERRVGERQQHRFLRRRRRSRKAFRQNVSPRSRRGQKRFDNRRKKTRFIISAYRKRATTKC